MLETTMHRITSQFGNTSFRQIIQAAVAKGFGGIGFSGHSYMFYAPKYSMSPESTEDYKKEIVRFVEKYDIDSALAQELLHYQFSLIRQLNENEVTVRSGYNFYPYFEDQSGTVPLKKQPSVLHIRSDKCFDNWADYARNVIWFGKRYSATLMVNPREHITYTEEPDAS